MTTMRTSLMPPPTENEEAQTRRDEDEPGHTRSREKRSKSRFAELLRAPTMAEMVLADEINTERQCILKALRFIVRNDFFQDKDQEIEYETRDPRAILLEREKNSSHPGMGDYFEERYPHLSPRDLKYVAEAMQSIIPPKLFEPLNDEGTRHHRERRRISGSREIDITRELPPAPGLASTVEYVQQRYSRR
eukprot:CAMPEP_0170190882 /NCGR_PEP_ID=MMETSP0040_2-20121228/50340_1 /TAXON_ID=641309 /ORGANISM="Lotharella oceanica, Strain CCMP622" /LENGTH=190 /DNA_ID=CAMNT_0010438839 /DNA_START=120 /DNA_END=688 /DNA_ORIENTATION=-